VESAIRTGKGQRRVPNWELFAYTPGVFVRVANAGVTGYGKLKSAEEVGLEGVAGDGFLAEVQEMTGCGQFMRDYNINCN